MADFTERLIFRMEVDASDFQKKLRDAVTAATRNLSPKLTLDAANIKIRGKIKASDLIDLSGLSSQVQGAVQKGTGATPSPTGTAAAASSLRSQQAAARRVAGDRALREQVARIKFIADDSSLGRVIRQAKIEVKFLRSQFARPFNIVANAKLFGARDLKRFLDRTGTAGRVAAASLLTVGRAARVAGRVAVAGLQGVVLVANAGAAAARKFASSIRRMARVAARAISPFTRLAGTIGRSVAVLTGSGLIIGGAAFLPVAAIRAATSAFKQLGEFVDGVSQSVTLFSNQLVALKGVDRIVFANDKFKELGDTVQDIASRFGLATSDVSKGLFSILSAQVGVNNVAERLEALESAANVAVGGVTDLESAFKGVIGISRTFGTTLTFAGDQLVAIQRLGQAPIARLATQIGRVASISKNAGARAEELGAAISTITAQSVPLETTITGLRQFFGTLSKGGSRQVQNLLKGVREETKIPITLDVNTLRRTGGLRTFLDQLQQLRNIRPGTVEKLFPQTRVIAALLPLLDNLNRFSRDQVEIQKSTGEAAAGAAQRLNTIAGAFSRLRSVISNTIVTVADQIAKLIDLRGIVERLIGNLDRFVKSLRSISSVDLGEFIRQLFTTSKGIRQLLEVTSRLFGGLVDKAIQISGPLVKVFVGIGIAIRRILTSALSGVFDFLLEQTVTSLSAVSRGIRKAIQETGGSLGPAASARLAAVKSIDTFTSALIDVRRKLGTLTETTGTSIDAAVKGAKAFDVEGIIKTLRTELRKFGRGFSDDILTGPGGKMVRRFEDELSGLTASIDATKIQQQISQLGAVIQGKVPGLPQLGTKEFAEGLKEAIFRFRSIDIAESLISGLDGLDKKGGERINALTQEAQRQARVIVETFKAAGQNVRFPGVLTFGAVRGSEMLATQVEAATAKVRELEVALKAAASGPELGRQLASAELIDAQVQLEKIQESASKFRAGLALPQDLFKAVGLEVPRDLLGQLRVVTQEVTRLNKELLADPGQVDVGRLKQVQELQKFAAIRVARFAEIIRADPKLKGQVTQGFQTLLEQARANVETIAKRVSPTIDIFGREIPIPPDAVAPIKEADRNKLQRQILGLKSLVEGVGKGAGVPGGLGDQSPLARGFKNLTDQILGLLEALGEIPAAVQEAAESGGSFDKITFFVADADQAARAFAEGLKRSLTDQRKEAEKLVNAFGMVGDAISDVASRLDQLGVSLETDAGFIGPRQLVNDSRVQTFNLVPDSVDDVEKSAGEATASQQNRAAK